MENSRLPAFAHHNPEMAEQVGRGISEGEYRQYTGGLTKREYFAGLAMQGLLAFAGSKMTNEGMENLIKESVQAADELLNQLSK